MAACCGPVTLSVTSSAAGAVWGAAGAVAIGWTLVGVARRVGRSGRAYRRMCPTLCSVTRRRSASSLKICAACSSGMPTFAANSRGMTVFLASVR